MEYFESSPTMMSKKAIIKEVLHYNPKANIGLIQEAYDYAKKKHKNQKRASGQNYFIHLLDVVTILISLKGDSPTICAGFLHDIIEDTPVTEKEIRNKFGREILNLIRGVTKIQEIKVGNKDEVRAENIRKIVLATTKDIRVILIKLADRLNNMRTLKHLPKHKQIRISKETLEIYAPIAYKLGMYQIKSELEDLTLKYLQPKEYQNIKSLIRKRRGERELEIAKICEDIRQFLQQKEIKAEVYGRAKNFYSIFTKMTEKNKKFDEIYDLMGVRIVIDSVEECYRVLGIVHAHFKPIPNRFKDYIAFPKPNMYQSIHTEVFFKGKPIEIQIRTKTMHLVAEYGVAAHWRYKGTQHDKKFENRIAWLRQVLDWKMTSENAQEFIESLKIDLFKDEIFVFTPKGDPIPLPERSTPVDFAYRVHTEIGNKCQSARVNGKIVPLDSSLKSGDICTIITNSRASPSRNWLKFVKTNQAKAKIRHFLKIHGSKEKKSNVQVKPDILFKHINIKGSKSQVKISKCCAIEIGQEIKAFKTKDGKITIHSATCSNIHALQPEREIPVSWKEEEKTFKKLRVDVQNKVGVLADILSELALLKVNIASINSKVGKRRYSVFFELDIPGTITPKSLIESLSALAGVVQVHEQ